MDFNKATVFVAHLWHTSEYVTLWSDLFYKLMFLYLHYNLNYLFFTSKSYYWYKCGLKIQMSFCSHFKQTRIIWN